MALPGDVAYGLDGTPQDCIDHMRKAHDTPPLVKAANLARWFLGQCLENSGLALHGRYRVFDRPGTHVAFHITYMERMHTFLEESDDASLRARHRRRAREMAAHMSWTTLQDTGSRAPDDGRLFSTQDIS